MSLEAMRAIVESARHIEPPRPLISRCAADTSARIKAEEYYRPLSLIVCRRPRLISF